MTDIVRPLATKRLVLQIDRRCCKGTVVKPTSVCTGGGGGGGRLISGGIGIDSVGLRFSCLLHVPILK